MPGRPDVRTKVPSPAAEIVTPAPIGPCEAAEPRKKMLPDVLIGSAKRLTPSARETVPDASAVPSTMILPASAVMLPSWANTPPAPPLPVTVIAPAVDRSVAESMSTPMPVDDVPVSETLPAVVVISEAPTDTPLVTPSPVMVIGPVVV
jgi:hypothetical protein